MNFENFDTQDRKTTQHGYEMIFDDIEENYIYFVLRAGDMIEISRSELLEMIKGGKPMPVIEIREKTFALSRTARG